MQIKTNDASDKIINKWAKARKLERPDAVRMLIRVGLARVAALSRNANPKDPAKKFSVRKTIGKLDDDAVKDIDKVLSDGLDEYATARELAKGDAADAIIEVADNRLTALDKYAERKKDEHGHVTGKRLTNGGNTAGWLKRKARRDGTPAAAKPAKPKAAPKPKPAKPKAAPKAKAAKKLRAPKVAKPKAPAVEAPAPNDGA